MFEGWSYLWWTSSKDRWFVFDSPVDWPEESLLDWSLLSLFVWLVVGFDWSGESLDGWSAWMALGCMIT